MSTGYESSTIAQVGGHNFAIVSVQGSYHDESVPDIDRYPI